MDNHLKICIETILNWKLSDLQWVQLTLPTSKGGLGQRCIRDLCLPAFLASTFSVLKIVKSNLSIDSDDFEISYVEDAITAWRHSNAALPETKHLSIQKNGTN